MLTLLFLDGLLLYGVIGFFCLLALVSMEYEKPTLCTIIVVIALVVLEFYSNLRPLSFAYHNPLDALLIVALYFVAGTTWIIAKWFSHVYKVRDRFNEVKQECIDRVKALAKKDDPVKPYFKPDGSLNEEGTNQVYRMAAQMIHEPRLPLLASDHKTEMFMWWLLWPLSLCWTLMSDPIIRLWHFVYNLFGDMMQAISNRAFRLDQKE